MKQKKPGAPRASGARKKSSPGMAVPVNKVDVRSGTKSLLEIEQELGGNLARYGIRLYVAGSTLNSFAAIQNTRRLCQEFLKQRAELEIIDLYQQPALAKRDGIIAAPCLLKYFPPPRKVFIGDLSDMDRLLVGLGVGLRKLNGNGRDKKTG